MTLDITSLWTRIVDGDHKAWQELVGRYATLVYTVARRTGLRQPEAEDCAQQTWLALYRRRRSIKDPQAIPAWLIRTTHREAVRMAQSSSPATVPDEQVDQRDTRLLPDESVASLEFQVALRKALALLDPRCRKLITEMYLSGDEKKYSDVASILGVKPNSFGPLRNRCLLKLRDILEKMGYGTD